MQWKQSYDSVVSSAITRRHIPRWKIPATRLTKRSRAYRLFRMARSSSSAHARAFPIPYGHLAAALLCGFALRLLFISRFPFYAGDTKFYEELAQNWLYHGVYGLFIRGELTAVDQRVPGYPAFLAAIYFALGRSARVVMVAQALVDLGTCVLAALIAARLATVSRRAVAGTAALWMAALCPFTADYTAVVLTETLATFFTTLAVLAFIYFLTEPALDLSADAAGDLAA